jgi:hypothetical protein
MHNYAKATGVAIARLLEDDRPEVVQEISEYAEEARIRLALDNSAVTAAMMFAQPLVKMWRPEWKFAYTIGLSLGAKFTTEGFYLGDIVDHLTDEFTLETLREGERIACEAYDWLEMNERVRAFRNALLNVTLEEPLATFGTGPSSLLPAGDEELHVLIVDDSKAVCALHRAMVLGLRPTARVHTCERCLPPNSAPVPRPPTDPTPVPDLRPPCWQVPSSPLQRALLHPATSICAGLMCCVRSVEAAREYLRDCNLKQEYVRLILVDFNLTEGEMISPSPLCVTLWSVSIPRPASDPTVRLPPPF